MDSTMLQRPAFKSLFAVAIVIIAIAILCVVTLKRNPAKDVAKDVKIAEAIPAIKDAESVVMPFALEPKMAISDFYFGQPAEYNPNDGTLVSMRQMALGLMKVMDNPKHPCNPLNTANVKIVGINIGGRATGVKIYTLWLSDGVITCGLEAMHSDGLTRDKLKGDFFQRFFLRDMASGFGYISQDAVGAVLTPDKKSFWKKDIGEVAHDMAQVIGGDSFFDNTLPQAYSGFAVADAYNVGYENHGYSYNAFTKNVVDAVLMRTDLPNLNVNDFSDRQKFQIFIQAEPNGSGLAFKLVYAKANNNGYDPAVLNGSANVATRLR
jgi:hypothetical protein